MWYREVIGANKCPIVDTWWQTETGGIMISPLPGVTATKPGSAMTAEILGIPSNKMFALGWAIGLSCVAVAGSMLSNFYYVFPDVGVNFSLFAFVAVALGGFGSITGSLIAGIIIGIVESVGGLLIDPSFKLLYVFAVYLFVVVVRPQGIFGRY
jgi:branched-chain amino acid transport system permease protein